MAANTVRTEACDPQLNAVVIIPSMSHDGIGTLPLYGVGTHGVQTATHQGFVSQQCGSKFGEYGIGASGTASGTATGTCLVSRVQPFTVGVVVGTGTNLAADDGFKLEYTQVPCMCL